MDKKLRDTTYQGVEIMNSKPRTTIKEETWSRGTNSGLQFAVNVMLNFSINPLSPNGDQHQFSPKDIHTLSRD